MDFNLAIERIVSANRVCQGSNFCSLFNQVMSNLLRNLNDEDLDATLEEMESLWTAAKVKEKA